ncbi:MAG TPA: DUF6086 family protein [Streptosporangiaceae bacterium]
MSYIFDVGEDTVWSPSLRVGRLYVAATRCLAAELDRPPGLVAVAEDMYQIDLAKFEIFVKDLFAAFSSTNHRVYRELMRGVLLPSLVLLERAGISPETTSDEEKTLMLQAQDLARSMPT